MFFLIDSIRSQNIHDSVKIVENTETAISIAELQIEVIEKLSRYSEDLNAILIVGWASLPDGDGSYEYLKAWASENEIGFADWHPAVASVKEAVPAIPLVNHHSGGHYRTWVNQMIAKSFADLIIVDE